MVVAGIALSVALGGTGYAASKPPENSVGPEQLMNNAVTSSKVKNHSLLSVDFKPGQLVRGVYEHRLRSRTSEDAGVPRTLILSKLPAGSYAIFGKAMLRVVTLSESSDAGCTLRAGPARDSDVLVFAGPLRFSTAHMQIVQTFRSAGTVSMSCIVGFDEWSLETGSIVAIRTDTATKTSTPVQ